jgi:hypothetical protein
MEHKITSTSKQRKTREFLFSGNSTKYNEDDDDEISVIVHQTWNTYWSSNWQVWLFLTQQIPLLPGKQPRTTYTQKHERMKWKSQKLKTIYCKQWEAAVHKMNIFPDLTINE